MALTPQQQAAREGKLTASRVGVLMGGSERDVLNLWHEMVGDPAYVPVDFDNYWPVQLGIVTENLSLDWYARRTGHPVTRRGEVVIASRAEWAAATLDGWDDFIDEPIECKHVGGRERREVVVGRYQPQFHWIMGVTDRKNICLSVIEGANEPALVSIPLDQTYADELWRRAEVFMKCVENLTPPVDIAPIAPPIIPAKTYDMAASNAWAEQASKWLKHRDAAKSFDKAVSELKALIPADAKIASGHGISASINKKGAVSFTKEDTL